MNFLFSKTKSKQTNKKPTEKQVIGKIGEDCVCKYLEKLGYKIIDRNYLKKWGEIDIVAVKNNKIYFIEVKSISRDLSTSTNNINQNVTYVTKGEYRAEDNMHQWKLQRLGRTIQSYLLEKDVSDETDWQFDVATVVVDTKKRISRVTLLEDLVL
jgi:putative endonuclease